MAEQENLDLFSVEESYIVGQTVAIFYQNPTNFYKVLLIRVTETNTNYDDKEIVVTGSFGQVQEEETYRFYGKVTEHPKFGVQFNAHRYKQEKPTSAIGVINYLSSDKFPGIGKKTAENIVKVLGEEAIDRISDDPTILQEVAGLNDKKRAVLVQTIQASDGMEKIIIGLNDFGFGSRLAYNIYQMYQGETLEIIQENPYQLVQDIENIGFKKADSIAEQLGFAADSPARLKAAVFYALNELCLSQGNTFTLAGPLLEESLRVLESSRPFIIDPDAVASELVHLIEENKIIEDNKKIYIKSLYASEWGISSSIKRLMDRKKISYNAHDIPKEIRKLEKRLAISYGKSQLKAIEEAMLSPMFILTGGPGTGKTTVLNGIVSLFAELNGLSLDLNDYTDKAFPILLAAPTGRAAKRMNETTGLPSSTIHRLLGLNGRESNNEEQQSERELEGGLLIIDEMSMVDTWLANQLLRAVPQNMQVLLVGDKNQLPSVGPGQILHDLIDTKLILSMELNEIYRQEDGSSIIPLAHEIKDGKLPADFTKNKKDRSLITCNAFQIEEVIRQVVTKAKLKGYTQHDIQVLAPMYRGPAGIDALNKMMQEILNPNDTGRRKEVKFNDKVYRIGDKILQLVNNPELNVFNGDMGEIKSISYAKETDDKVDELVIQFDANEVTYKRNEWNKITLAYCCSIHKSQGSEFKMVILPMVHSYGRMLRRDLLYTAITRSSELLILCGEISAFQESVVKSSATRLTTLKERLWDDGVLLEESKQSQEDKTIVTTETREKTSPKISGEEISLFEETKGLENKTKSYRLTIDLIKKNTINPMIGMEGITP